MTINDRGKRPLETIDENDIRKTGKSMVEQSQVIQINAISPELQHFIFQIPNMAGTSFSVPAIFDAVYADLPDITLIDNAGTTGHNIQVFLDELHLNPMVLSEEHAIAIATEYSLLSLPFDIDFTDQALHDSVIFSESPIISTQ